MSTDGTESAETAATPQVLKVEIGNNVALATLYGLGGALAGIGLLIAAIATAQVANAYDPSGALGWQAFGGTVLNFGAMLVVGGIVAHAINWQIARSAGK